MFGISRQQSDPPDGDQPVRTPTGNPRGRPREKPAATTKNYHLHTKDEGHQAKDELRANVLAAIEAYIDRHEGMTAKDFCEQFGLPLNSISVWRRGFYAIRDWDRKGPRPYIQDEKWPGFHHAILLAEPLGLTLDELCLGRPAADNAAHQDEADGASDRPINRVENDRLRREVAQLREQLAGYHQEIARLSGDLELADHAGRVSEHDRRILATVRFSGLDVSSLKDAIILWLASQNRNLADQ